MQTSTTSRGTHGGQSAWASEGVAASIIKPNWVPARDLFGCSMYGLLPSDASAPTRCLTDAARHRPTPIQHANPQSRLLVLMASPAATLVPLADYGAPPLFLDRAYWREQATLREQPYLQRRHQTDLVGSASRGGAQRQAGRWD